MKMDFRKALKELKKTCALQILSMHANLVQDIVTGIQDVIQPALETSTLPNIQDIDAT